MSFRSDLNTPSTQSRASGPRCLIGGGGPAGMMLGYLLARAGVSVIVLEKHADFLRDFRGDTVHPSTLQILDEVGLLGKFEQLPQRRVQQLSVQIGGVTQRVIDFHGLKPFDYMALVPQWDFLDLLAEEGKRYASFELRMRHEVLGLIEENARVVGLHVRTPDGDTTVRADLVMACDGRDSTIRTAANLRSDDYGAPMDVLWFRLPRTGDAPDETFAIVGAGHMMVLLNRSDYWQAAYVVPKGSDTALRSKPIATLRDGVAKLAPFLSGVVGALASWDDVKTLVVRVDRLRRWYRSGLLCIGDAAHAMSPVGGVGINLAIQDAVAAANILTEPLVRGGPVDDAWLQRVQQRRERAVKLTQAVQLQIQKRVLSNVLASSATPPRPPAVARWLLRFRVVRNIPARVIGYGFRREHVRT